jgi:hypothetical protein
LAEKPDCHLNTLKPFALRETTLSSLQILDDIPCDYAEWVDDCSENSWVARTLKLWFFTRKNFALVHKWAKWPDIVHTSDEAFFKKGSSAIEDDVEDLQTHLQKICGEMDLLNISSEALARIECLVEHLGGIQLCDPHADVVDSSIGQFMMFCLRDVLRYLGLVHQPPSDRVPFMEHKLLTYKKQFFAD